MLSCRLKCNTCDSDAPTEAEKGEVAVSGKTALSRGENVSVPTTKLVQRGLITGTVLHHGSGKAAADTNVLSEVGESVTEFDPTYAINPDALTEQYDTVVSNYVLNTLHPSVRDAAISDIAKTTKGNAFVTVRGKGDVIKGTKELDGVRTSKGTFQKTYTTEELKRELEAYFDSVEIIFGGDKSKSITAKATSLFDQPDKDICHASKQPSRSLC